jgi:hypothetical protein
MTASEGTNASHAPIANNAAGGPVMTEKELRWNAAYYRLARGI